MNRRHALAVTLAIGAARSAGTVSAAPAPLAPLAPAVTMQEYPVPAGTHPHDVACSGQTPEAGIWFTAQATGHLGWLDPLTEAVQLIPLAGPGQRS